MEQRGIRAPRTAAGRRSTGSVSRQGLRDGAMNPRALIPLILGLGIAGFAAKLGLDYVRKAQGNQIATVELWAPTEMIPRGVAISESMLKAVAFPIDAAPRDAYAKKEKLIGRVPHTGAPAGLPILDSMLLPPGAKAGIEIPPGLRAVAVKIDESSGVDYHIEPGSHVDVIGYFTVRRAHKNETIATTLIEDVEVAAVGQQLAPSAPSNEDEDDGKRRKPTKPARAVTLLVKPETVPKLHLAEQRGKIKLSMRGRYDDGSAQHAGRMTEDQVIGGNDPNADDGDPSGGGELGSLLGGLASMFNAQSEPADPVAQPVPEPAPQLVKAPPQPAWKMRIIEGGMVRELAWMTLDSTEAIDVSESGPNLFQDPAENKTPVGIQLPTPPTDNTSRTGAGVTGDAVSNNDPDDDETDDDEYEQQELFE